MTSLPPRVIGPLSVCSTSVRVQGQQINARVKILMDDRTVGGGVASWPDQVFDLDAGIRLLAGTRITAIQTLERELPSDPSPEPVIVQAMPSTINLVEFVSHLYVCGQRIWINGAIPGAFVQISESRTGRVLGSATSPDGNARILLDRAIMSDEILDVKQIACGIDGPIKHGPSPDPLPKFLPPPRVRGPLKSCQQAVRVSDVFEGAKVTLNRSGGSSVQYVFDRSSLWIPVDPQLMTGENISAREDFIPCDQASDSATVEVEDPEPVPIPQVIPPLCEGSTTVRVAGLIPGSRVRILQAGIELGIGSAPESYFDFHVPLLREDVFITAQQELCDIWSDQSNKVYVDRAPDDLPTPVIPGPLFECASVVRVTNIHPGVRVLVFSSILSAPIGYIQANDEEVDVPVSPHLIVNDNIHAIQVGCNHTSSESTPSLTVQVTKLSDPPELQLPINECMKAIPVVNAIPGAQVEVYVNNVWHGTAVAGTSSLSIPIFGRLNRGDEIRTRQRLCAIVTEFSSFTTVLPSPGKWNIVRDSRGQEEIAQVLAVHAALLHSGHILYFGGDEHDPGHNVRGRIEPSVLHTARLFDCKTNVITNVEPVETDVFCCGHAFLADGRLIVAGGTGSYDEGMEARLHGETNPHEHFTGLSNTFIFDPNTGRWTPAAEMNPRPGQNIGGGRWYPTLICLPNGEVFAMSGHPNENEREGPDIQNAADIHKNRIPEIFSLPSPTGRGVWRTLTFLGDSGQSDYPRLHVIPSQNGQFIFNSSTLFGGDLSSYLLDTSNIRVPLSICSLRGIEDIYFGYHSTSVMLPLLPEQNYTPRILLCGGRNPIIIEPTDPNRIGSEWRWRPIARRDMDPPRTRHHVNSVLLPTGEVFICGGVDQDSGDTGWNIATEHEHAVREGEIYIYDPVSDSMRTTPAATVIRNYHSVALLMPDGRVWTAGSNKAGNYSYRFVERFNRDEQYRLRALMDGWDDPNARNRELRIEIFEPSYVCADRPEIISCPSSIGYNQQFEIRTTQAAQITRTVVIRAGSVTHAFNSDQRYIKLISSPASGDRITVTGPPSPIDAPGVTVPGYYLLFVVRDNIPSEGKFIRIGS